MTVKLWRILVLLMLSTAILSACVPATMSDSTASTGSSIRYVWVQIYNQSMPMWRGAADWVPILVFFTVIIAGGAIALFFTLKGEGGVVAFLGIFGLAFVLALYFSYSSWKSIVTRAPIEVTQASDSGSQNGISTKKAEVAMRYAELLNYQFTGLLPNATTDFGQDSLVVKVCNDGYDTPSNCAPYERVYPVDPYQVCVARDDKGNCTSEVTEYHYQHDPYVTILVRYAGVSNLPDKYSTPETGLTQDPGNPDHPLMFFSGWMIPTDYENRWYSSNRFFENLFSSHPTFDPTDYTPPVDWLWYHQVQNAQSNMGVTSWHQYSNPLLATANAGFIGDPAVIANLQSANMLLNPRDLNSPAGGNHPTYFDFVYPLGSIGSWNVDWAGFSADAQKVNFYYGNALHISNSFAFVSEDELAATGVSLDTLVYSIKADLYNENKWQKVFSDKTLFTIMQQNTILTTCVVSNGPEGLYIKSDGCRVMSGLPIGNETLKEAFASGIPDELANIPFTPEGFFGNPVIITAADGKLAMSGTNGHPMYLWERFGAKKPSMDENFAYLVDRVQLTQDEINQVITAAVDQQKSVTRGLYLWPGIILVVEILMILVVGFAGISSSQ